MQPIPHKFEPLHTSYSLEKKSRLPFIIASIIVITIIFSIIIIIYVPTPEPRISKIYLNLVETHLDHLDVAVLVGTTGTASVAGKGDIEIIYNNKTIYTFKIIIDETGEGRIEIPYNSFIEGNGNYYFHCMYKGKLSPPEIYHVRYIVERVDIGWNVDFEGDEGQMRVDINLLQEDGMSMDDNPKGAILTIDEIKQIDDETFITEGDQPIEIFEHFYRIEYPFNRSGNYILKVTLENTRINPKSNSPYQIITRNLERFLNILPRANAQITNSYVIPTSSNYTVEFDASSSLNDGDITKYIWDFNNDGNVDLETTGPYVNYSGYVRGQNYNAILNVEGDVIIDPALNEMEKGAVIIQVNSP